MKREAAERRGRRAEALAALWLQLKGWRVLARRVRTHVGEIDLIVRRGATLAFVEVKARGSDRDLALALDQRRLQRVAAAAHALTPRFARDAQTVRIDVVLLSPGRWPRHLANVWHG